MRQFLIAMYPITPAGLNWEIRRWDGWHYHRETGGWQPDFAQRIHLWETASGQIVGVVNEDSPGNACFQFHPDYRPDVEAAMLTWAEDHLAASDDAAGSNRILNIFALDYDSPMRLLLQARGYARMTYGGVTRRMVLGARPLAQPQALPGYRVRTTADTPEDYQRMAALLNAGFGRTSHTPEEYQVFATTSPSFQHHLNLVAAAPDGAFAAHVGYTYIEAIRCAILEPLCTHPDHRRRGLAQALILEGLHRVKALGANAVLVDTGDMIAANTIYDVVGFTEAYRGSVWRRSL